MRILVIHNHTMPLSAVTRALENKNCPFTEAVGFEDGYEQLSKNTPGISAIIVQYSPLSDDEYFLKKLAGNDKLRDIPLILSLSKKQQAAVKSFSHTASYQWLLNPFTDHTLYSMVQSAENEYVQRCALRQEIHCRESAIGTITRGTFRLKTFEQAEALTTMLSLACPEPDRVALGLFEMLANGIEHGNLEIGNEEKRHLMADNRHRDEIRRRLALPEYRDRYVEITFEREETLVFFKIEDQGAGFDYAKYLHMDFSANQTYHGRGIALARATSFDYLEFLGCGNKLLAITKFTKKTLNPGGIGDAQTGAGANGLCR